MSKSKPSGQAQEIAANGGSPTQWITLPESPPDNSADIIARFQLDTEKLIATLRSDHQRQISEQDRKIGTLIDQWEGAKLTIAEMRGKLDASLHEMNEGVKEVRIALTRAVDAAASAARSVEVFDKLKASQPDFHRAVQDVAVKLAKLSDVVTHQRELHEGLSKRLDGFEVVADDYEETKGTVRGLDNIVSGLDRESKQRKKTGMSI